MTDLRGASYIQQERRAYSLYVLQSRAIPHIADGLKAASRRVLWIARDGKEYKTASLAGATMPIHPHDSPEGAVNTLAAPYGNNVPLLKGDGAFGTLLKPTAYGAARYTAVSLSTFAKDVLLRDTELIPMVENYDSTQYEPKHFLPLIPIVLLNPQQGIAIGFACSILPRSLEDIIMSQILYLKGKKVPEKLPSFEPTNDYCTEMYTENSGSIRYVFHGGFERTNATTIQVTDLPYNMTHSKFIERLDKLCEEGQIQDFVDDSKDIIDIKIRFKKGTLSNTTDEQIFSLLGLTSTVTENLNVIDFNGERVLSTSFADVIGRFTEWRLQWYYQRYERLKQLLAEQIQKYQDILLAIKKNVGSVARKVHSRDELKEFLEHIGVHYLDYIADLPVYRFTEDEKQKVQRKLQEAEDQMEHYNKLLTNEGERRKVYISELQQILRNYNKGHYNAV